MKIKRTSLIFRLAKLGGLPHHWEDEPYSICEINQYLFFGILLFIVLIFLGGLGIVSMITSIYYGTLWIIDHNNAFPNLEGGIGILISVGIGFWTVLISVGSIEMIFRWNEKRTIAKWQANLPQKKPSALSLHWKAFREKVCFKVDIID